MCFTVRKKGECTLGISFWIVISIIIIINVAILVRANASLDKQEEILELLKKMNHNEENK